MQSCSFWLNTIIKWIERSYRSLVHLLSMNNVINITWTTLCYRNLPPSALIHTNTYCTVCVWSPQETISSLQDQSLASNKDTNENGKEGKKITNYSLQCVLPFAKSRVAKFTMEPCTWQWYWFLFSKIISCWISWYIITFFSFIKTRVVSHFFPHLSAYDIFAINVFCIEKRGKRWKQLTFFSFPSFLTYSIFIF